MDWPTPQHSRNQVNRAGDILCAQSPSSEEYAWAADVLTNWRSCHNYPINTFQATLRSRLKSIDQDAIVAQRLKRTPSIVSKLRRFEGMNLARMQDIGGLRAVVSSLARVRKLERSYLDSRFAHRLALQKDYIDQPKSSGYRGVHLVYKYENQKVPHYNGLQVELQIRTRLQHAWATAVETMGTFLDHALKSSEGPDEWLQFFALAGSAFAHIEGTPPVPGFEGLTRLQTFRRLSREASGLDVRNRLQAFSVAVDAISSDSGRGEYHLVVLDPTRKEVNVQSFGRARLEEANRKYTEAERRIADGEQIQAVLVSAGPIGNLRRAYPNYFLDTRAFVRRLDGIEAQARRGARSRKSAKKKASD